jgi:hypothetical protein
MTRLFSYLKPYWRQVLLTVILVLVEAMSIKPPNRFGHIVCV